MKKIKNILLLCLVTILATGCVKYNATMTINKDKSMDFTVIYAFDKSLMGESGSLKEEQFDGLKNDGYTVEKYSEGNYEGFKLIKKIKNIDDLSTDKDVEFNLSGMMSDRENDKYMFKLVKDGEKNTYYAKFKFDSNDSGMNTGDDLDEDLPDEDVSLTVEEDGSDGLIVATNEDDNKITESDDSDFDMSALANSMDLKFEVNLPSAAISSNATTKENGDKKLIWKLNYSGSQTIEFAFDIDPNASDSNILLYIGVGVGILVVLLIVFLLTKKKGPKEIVPVNENKVEIKNEDENISKKPMLNKKAEVLEDKE